eukprot:5828369-Alexandrium_andersonii.AAC.1
MGLPLASPRASVATCRAPLRSWRDAAVIVGTARCSSGSARMAASALPRPRATRRSSARRSCGPTSTT